MSDNMNSFDFFSTLLGSRPSVSTSKDGKSINFNGEIASGIDITISDRPSTSCGRSFDAKIDGIKIAHIDGVPKLK